MEQPALPLDHLDYRGVCGFLRDDAFAQLETRFFEFGRYFKLFQFVGPNQDQGMNENMVSHTVWLWIEYKDFGKWRGATPKTSSPSCLH